MLHKNENSILLTTPFDNTRKAIYVVFGAKLILLAAFMGYGATSSFDKSFPVFLFMASISLLSFYFGARLLDSSVKTEKIIVHRHKVEVISSSIFGRRTIMYAIDKIKNLSFAKVNEGGYVYFDYEKSAVKLGNGISYGEFQNLEYMIFGLFGSKATSAS